MKKIENIIVKLIIKSGNRGPKIDSAGMKKKALNKIFDIFSFNREFIILIF